MALIAEHQGAIDKCMSQFESSLVPISTHQTNGTLGSVVTLTKPDGARKLLLQCTTGAISVTLDGTAPSSTVGFHLTPNFPPILFLLTSAMSVKIIERTASSAIAYQWGQ